MAHKIRPARMAALYVEWGDVIVTGPGAPNQGVIGTVIRAESRDGWRIITLRRRNGDVEEMQPVAEERPVWVNVPSGTA